MDTQWVPTIKPTFIKELQALPANEMQQVVNKISTLLEDPLPDGKIKKELKYLDRNLYRLRSGNYRIIYQLADPYVYFVKLDRRDESNFPDAFTIDADADDIWELNVSTEQYNRIDLEISEIRLSIVRLSPSFALYTKLCEGGIPLESLNWREFEELIADLLQKDGYHVELGPGRNDGGKDIIAIKELEPIGTIMSVWQAKKLKTHRKVGIEFIRELADTRNELKASKGIIVTSTYLTRGALHRVQRDQYILGKIDKNDLFLWMRRLKR